MNHLNLRSNEERNTANRWRNETTDLHIPLRWMLEKAESCDLEFTRDVLVKPDAYLGDITDSYTKFWVRKYKGRLFRKLSRGINEFFDSTIAQREKDPKGKAAEGYPPYRIRNTP